MAVWILVDVADLRCCNVTLRTEKMGSVEHGRNLLARPRDPQKLHVTNFVFSVFVMRYCERAKIGTQNRRDPESG
jgi:hypothetical protein